MEPLRLCTKCGEFKPLSAFYKQTASPDGLNNHCKECIYAYVDAHREVHKARRAARRKASQERDAAYIAHYKTRDAASMRKRKYNLTTEGYNALVAAQEGKCAICGNPPVEGKELFVDHNHLSNKVRGLLCHRCNQGLIDDIAWHQKAIEYLQEAGRDAVDPY
jgi:hypothetical protein